MQCLATYIVMHVPSTAPDSNLLQMAIPQQSSSTHDDNNVQCSSSFPQSAEVTYVEELIAENPSANIAFMGRYVSVKAADESMVVEVDASTPVQEYQDETPFQQESKAGADKPAAMLMAKNSVFPVKGDIVTGTVIYLYTTSY